MGNTVGGKDRFFGQQPDRPIRKELRWEETVTQTQFSLCSDAIGSLSQNRYMDPDRCIVTPLIDIDLSKVRHKDSKD